MIKQKVILAFLLCIIASSGAFAQLSKVKRARAYMEELNYMGAIELYNQIGFGHFTMKIISIYMARSPLKHGRL